MYPLLYTIVPVLTSCILIILFYQFENSLFFVSAIFFSEVDEKIPTNMQDRWQIHLDLSISIPAMARIQDLLKKFMENVYLLTEKKTPLF